MNDHTDKPFRAPHSPLRGQQIRVTGPILTDRRIKKWIEAGYYGERVRNDHLRNQERAKHIKQAKKTTCKQTALEQIAAFL